MAKNSCQKKPNFSEILGTKVVQFWCYTKLVKTKSVPINWNSLTKKKLLKNINLGAHFLFLLILCSIKIERLLFLKFLKNLAFFDSYFWPFSKSEEKIKVIFVISAIMSSIWNVFIEFRWHDEKLRLTITLR